MKHFVFGLSLTSLFLISGCTTSVEFVRRDTTPQKQAIVRYYPPSSPKREAEYKAELNKQATNFCGGEFKITKEYQALGENDSSTGVGTGFGIGTGGSVFVGGSSSRSTMYNFVEFVCI